MDDMDNEIEMKVVEDSAPEEQEPVDAEPKQQNSEEPEAAAEEPSYDGLVKMEKDGNIIHAHPAVVAHHESHGWKVI